MKPKKLNFFRHSSGLLTICLALTAAAFPRSASATAYTWDGGGGTASWSNVTNWSTDTAPAATGDTLVFAGTSNLFPANDFITALSTNTADTSITFASGASSFNLSGNTITMGSGGGGGQVIVQQNSTNNQSISSNINLSGGSGDRSIVFASGAGSLTLSGNINFSNDWLFPTTTAGTIVLSGNNSGDGKAYSAGGITGGTNTMNAMMRNNVAGTQLVIGSDTALGNSGAGNASTGTASFRGILANQNMFLSTTGGDRNLSASSLAINTGNIDFNGTNNLTIGNIITVGGNRDFKVTSTGGVTVSNGIFLSSDQTGRQLFVNTSGAGGIIVNGTVSDTFHSSGLSTAGSSLLRKAGTGTMTLNGNSSYASVTQVENGTLKIGHANALGATGTTSGTKLMGGSLDLNGQTIGETLAISSSSSNLINSSGTSAAITADASVSANFTVNATGDITAARFIGSSNFTVTKTGNGTLTTNGTSHNSLSAWNVQAGKVVFANTSGYGADRGVAINGGTLQLSGTNDDLINNNEAFTLNSGVFDLSGKSEAVASVAGSGGTIRNSLTASTSTLFVGGGPSGTSSASYAGVIEDGVGTLKLTKEGTGTQTLTGSSTYTGATTITGGSLKVNGILAAGSALTIQNVNSTLAGTGTVAGSINIKSGAILAPGDSTLNAGVETLAVGNASSTLVFESGSIFSWDLDGNTNTSRGVAGGHDGIDLTGALNIDATAIFRAVLGSNVTAGSFWQTAHTWSDIFSGGSLTGGFQNNLLQVINSAGGTFDQNTLYPSSGYRFSVSGTSLTWSAVPEPSGAFAAILIAAGIARRKVQTS